MSLTHLILSFAAECPPGGVSPRPVLTSVPLSSVVTFAVQQLLQVLVFPSLQHHQCGTVSEGLCCVRGCEGLWCCVCVCGGGGLCGVVYGIKMVISMAA